MASYGIGKTSKAEINLDIIFACPKCGGKQHHVLFEDKMSFDTDRHGMSELSWSVKCNYCEAELFYTKTL